MSITTTIIVLAIWAGIGSLFYEKPPCAEFNEAGECIDQPVVW